MHIDYEIPKKKKQMTEIKHFILPECITSKGLYWLRVNSDDFKDVVIISGARNSIIKFHDTHTNKCLKTCDISNDSTHLSSFVYNQVSNEFVCGTGEGTLKIFDYKMNYLRDFPRSLISHRTNITCLQIIKSDDDDYRLVSASDDDTIKIWNSMGECVRTLVGHSTYVRSILYIPKANKLVSGSIELKIWNMSTYEGEHTLDFERQGFFSVVRCMTLISDNVFCTGGSSVIQIWHLNEAKCVATLKGHTKYVRCLLYIKDLNMLVSGSDDTKIKIWNIKEKEYGCLKTLNGHKKCVNCLSTLPLFNELVSCSSDFSLRIWNVKTGRCLRVIDCHNDNIRGLICHELKISDLN